MKIIKKRKWFKRGGVFQVQRLVDESEVLEVLRPLQSELYDAHVKVLDLKADNRQLRKLVCDLIDYTSDMSVPKNIDSDEFLMGLYERAAKLNIRG